MKTRLLSFYDQLPHDRRRPYGRIIMLANNGKLDEAIRQAEQWQAEMLRACRKYGDDDCFWAMEVAFAGCLLTILKS